MDPNKYPKAHAYQNHVPRLFHETHDPATVSQKRLSALKQLAEWLFGTTGTVLQLAEYSSSMRLLCDDYKRVITQAQKASARALCREMNVAEPERFSLEPLSTPGMLVHWKAILMLLAELEEGQRVQFLRMFDDPPDECSTAGQ